MNNNLEELITALYDMIQDAKSVPLSSDKCIIERDKALDMLDDLSAQLPAELNILHASQLGRVHTLIVRGDPKAIRARMALYDPLLMEALPLSLEEIFIYEMGGEHYGVQDIVL